LKLKIEKLHSYLQSENLKGYITWNTQMEHTIKMDLKLGVDWVLQAQAQWRALLPGDETSGSVKGGVS
jgi:hypothetical protein